MPGKKPEQKKENQSWEGTPLGDYADAESEKRYRKAIEEMDEDDRGRGNYPSETSWRGRK